MKKRMEALILSIRGLPAIPVLCLLLTLPLAGLDPDKPVGQYLVDKWEVGEGIPANTIPAATQTPDGYLWFATTRGLVRFDGITFTPIDFSGKIGAPRTGTPVPDTLYVDRAGTLYIGSSQGLTAYPHREGRFHTLTAADGITPDRIRRIKEDMHGNLWISFFASYVNLYSQNRFTSFTGSQGLEGKKINAIVETQAGLLLFATRENGVFIFKEGKFSPYPIPGTDNLQINDMFADHQGDLWIAGNAGLFRCTGDTTHRYTGDQGLSNDYITTVTQDSDKNLWVGTAKGLNRVQKRAGGKIAVESLIPGVTVYCLYEDREKSLWVGTFDSGLMRLKESKFISYAPMENQGEDILLSVFRDRRGDTWIGTLSGKLFHCRGDEFVETIQAPELSGTGIAAVAEDTAGNLWLGSNGKGAFKQNGRSFTRWTTGEGLADNLVSSIFLDSRGNLWFATFDGASVLYKGGDSMQSFNSAAGLSGKRVHNFMEDGKGNTWIAADRGVTVLDGDDITGHNARYFLEGIPVTCMYEDTTGSEGDNEPVYWVATHGAGLKRLQGKRITTFSTREGLTTNYIYRFFPDGGENFWLMSDSGVLRIARGELLSYEKGDIAAIHCTSFGISDGMKSLEFNNEFSRNSALKTPGGDFWFLTKKGISIVNPARVRLNKVPPPVVIEEARFDQRPLPLSPAPEGVTLKGTTGAFFRFTAPTFLAPGKIKFKYRLEGRDDDWILLPPGKERAVRYANLEPGTYKFQVIACNALGIWNNTGASLDFTIEPLFYRTLLFKIALLLVLAVAIYITLHIYRNKPNKQEKYKGSHLAPEYADECIKKLKGLMEAEKIYRDTELSLPKLADRMAVSPHLLSQLLNERLEQNFSDFINSYRVAEAQEILSSPRAEKMKIAVIAFDTGFNTVVAFYNAFKKFTGKTPARYKREAAEKRENPAKKIKDL